MANIISDIIVNSILVSCFFAFVIAQLLKAMYFISTRKRLSYNLLIEYGGMPSSHAATVAALSYSVYLYEGLSSAFTMSLIFAFIIIRDALGLRREIGHQAQVINSIAKGKLLKEDVGHTIAQVIVGILIGIAVSTAVYFILQ